MVEGGWGRAGAGSGWIPKALRWGQDLEKGRELCQQVDGAVSSWVSRKLGTTKAFRWPAGSACWGPWPCLPAQDPAGSPCSHRDADRTFRKEQDPASPKASACTGWCVWVGSFHAWAGTNKGPWGGTPAILSTASSDPTCCHCYSTGATRHVLRAVPTVPQPHQGVYFCLVQLRAHTASSPLTSQTLKYIN